MDKEFSIIEQANKIILDFEKSEKNKATYNVATDIYKKNNDFYTLNKPKKEIITINHNQIIADYNKIINRLFYLSVVVVSVTVIMIMCKIFL